MDAQKVFDYVIIGAGPAGLQLGSCLEKDGLDYLILEAGDSPGSFFKTYPRHCRMISNNKIYTGYDNQINLRHDWNSLLSESEAMLFKHYSRCYFPAADDFVRYLSDFAAYFHLNVQYETRVVKIVKKTIFTLFDSSGNTYHCERLIVATGVTKPYIPPVPGIELAERYTDVSIDKESFTNQRVLIVGKSNSAFETADHLIETAAVIHMISPHSVRMAWKTHYVGDLRAVNNNFLDTYQLKSQNLLLDGDISKIERINGKYIVSVHFAHADGEEEELLYDRVILCTGFRFDASIFDESCRPLLAIKNRFPAQTSEWESVNVRDLYFVGTLTQMRDFKKKTSGFIHGFRYNARTLYAILAHKYHGRDLPFELIEPSVDDLVDSIIDSVNVSSALWQQYGFLCDLIVVSDDGKEARYYKELPVDYIHDTELGQNSHYYVITLEFGLDRILASPDPFALERVHKDDVNRAMLSTALHPIVRRYAKSALISEHHVIEDICSEWLEEVHIKPLLRYFQESLQLVHA